MMHLKTKVFVFVLLAVIGALPVYAQVAGSAVVSGTVRDASGAVVPAAQVLLSNDAKGIHREMESNDAGVFNAPSLVPADGYSIKVSKQGFAAWEVKSFALQVGQVLNFDVALSVASTAEAVTVSEQSAPLVTSTAASVSNVVNENQIRELPINGRRVDSFVLLTPGVTNDATFGLLSFRGVAGNNSFLLDGNDNTEQFYDENAGRTRIASQVSQDAVQEFQVVSANFSAEYGKAMGGVVNTVTKSGSNQVHGTAFYYFRSTGFDARDPFAAFNPSEHRVQTGGTVGGAIIKDKLFYFLSVDVTRRIFPMVDSITGNSAVNSVTQTWIGCGTGATPATAAQCAAINTLLPRYYGSIPRTASNDLYFGRLDYHLTDRNTFSASFNYLRWLSPNGIQTGLTSASGAGINGNGDDSVRVRNGRFVWTGIPTNSFVNTARFGWDTDRQADDFDSRLLGGGLGYLQVSVSGVALGPASYLPRVEPSETRYEFADDAVWTKGAHSLKLGFGYSSSEDYNYFISTQFGSYSYQTANAFALDYSGNPGAAKNWTSYSQTFGNPVQDYTIKEMSLYLQDQWRVNNKLTVTAGARYEHSFAVNLPITNPDWPLTGHVATGPLNLSPRISLAYKVNDKTIVRAGYGTFFARLLGGMVDNLYTTNGMTQISDSLSATNPLQKTAGPVFPNALAAPPTGPTVGAAAIQFVAPNIKTPYSEQATLTVERQLAKNLDLTVSGIWSRGVNLVGVLDLNAPTPTTTATYTIADASGNAVGSYTTPVYVNPRPNTKYGRVAEDTNGVDSWYSGLVVSVDKRFAHGFQNQASYTWAHEIDDGQGFGGTSVIFFSSPISTFNGNYRFDKGSGSLDQRHRFVDSFVWAPTFTHKGGAFLRYVVNNWQFSGITTFAAGKPYGSATIRITDTPVAGMVSTSSLNGFGGNSRVPFLPVNTFYLQPSYRADVRITKAIPLGKEGTTRSLNLIFEAFNISNSWADTTVSTQVYSEAGRVLTLTPANNGQPLAAAGFPDGTQARRLQIAARLTF